jgi:hypothetical protein
MTAALRRLAVIAIVFCLATGMAVAQDEQPAPGSPAAPGFGFAMGLGIGVQTFNEPGPQPGPEFLPVTYQTLSLTPDFSWGKLGVGLSLALNYNFAGSDGSIKIRREDWWPTNEPVTFQNVLAIYLPKIAYVRWGLKGDPLFLKFGSFNDATLGDGFVMGDYSNTLFLPTERHFGLQADVDGTLFDFPYVGMESVVGNLARFDVMGIRAYARPLAKTSIPIFDGLQVGVTAAVDTEPYHNTASAGSPSMLSVLGVGALMPIIYTKDVFSLIAYTDAATIQARTWGSMAGVGGRIINIFTYGAQLRLLGSGFIPTYFGPAYDALRDVQYDAVTNANTSAGVTFGGLISAGVSLLGDKLIFKLTLDAPFITEETTDILKLPHLNAILSLASGVLPVFSFDFSYDKKGIGSFASLVDPTNAAIQGKLNLQSGPAVISFIYIITYDQRQSPDPWTVTSGLQCSIALF